MTICFLCASNLSISLPDQNKLIYLDLIPQGISIEICHFAVNSTQVCQDSSHNWTSISSPMRDNGYQLAQHPGDPWPACATPTGDGHPPAGQCQPLDYRQHPPKCCTSSTSSAAASNCYHNSLCPNSCYSKCNAHNWLHKQVRWEHLQARHQESVIGRIPVLPPDSWLSPDNV